MGEAYEQYVDLGFRHQNPHFRGNADLLRATIEKNGAETPDKFLEIQRAVQDGDLLAIYLRARQLPTDRGGPVFHVIRCDQGRNIEPWDVGQAEPEVMPK